MKKNRPFVIIVILLGSISFWLFIHNSKSTLTEVHRDFGTKDTGSLVKIFLADKSGQEIKLEKQADGLWNVNGNNSARPDAVKSLLTTIHDVEVRSPVGKAAYNNVIKAIASKGIKVELYDSKGIVKTYYVGSPTADQLGTFMYIENSTIPFVTHIPGFNGYLTPRFSTREDDWKLKNVFMLRDGMLESLNVIDRERQGYAFSISRNTNDSYKLLDLNGSEVSGVSQDKIINYLQSYGLVNYEMGEKSLNQHQKDSLLTLTPFRSIKLKYKNGKEKAIDFWRRPVANGTAIKTDTEGKSFNFDVDRMTAKIVGDTDLIVVQYFSFDKLFRKSGDFLISKPVK